MAVLKDVFDILKENPGITNKIGDFFKKVFSTNKGTKDATAIEDFKALLKAAEDEDFEQQFTRKLDYYAALLSLIAQTVFVVDKGVLIENFYHPVFNLFFPPCKGELLLVKEKAGTEDERWVIGNTDGTLYHFYLVNFINTDYNLEKMEAELNHYHSIGVPQEESFKATLAQENMKDEWCFGVTVLDKPGVYRLYQSIHNLEPDDTYNLGRYSADKSRDIKMGIIRDIKKVLDY